MSTTSTEVSVAQSIDQEHCAFCKRVLQDHETVRPFFDDARCIGLVHSNCPPYETFIDARARERAEVA